MQGIGVYLHVPFCASKCPYCDFYSMRGDDAAMDAYTHAACACMDRWAELSPPPADTLYLGGGTPALLGPRRLARLLERAALRFGLGGGEITLEANPGRGAEEEQTLAETLRGAAEAGYNRLSMGVQSADPEELRFLGRRHDAQGAARAVEAARGAGFANISLDLMLGVPRQTVESTLRSVDFLADLGVEHISSYLLKVEEGTPFARRNVQALCPDEDRQADIYLAAVERLAQRGYRQYEISNFARPGCESRHNLKYWNCEDYLGMGPAAHGLFRGVRYFYARDLRGFVEDPSALLLEEGGDPGRCRVSDLPGVPAGAAHLPTGAPRLPTGAAHLPTGAAHLPTGAAHLPAGAARPRPVREYGMLRLRLTEGLPLEELERRYPMTDRAALERKAAPFVRAGLCRLEGGALSLTPRGFLVSTPLIAELLEALEP